MGFSSERATMALILNEGRVEQSVAWLFDAGEDSDHRAAASGGGGHLKIDISEELARITEMETKFKCSKQEVERAVVACEGDLDQAAETLKSQKHEPPAAPKVEESGEPPAGPPKAAAQNSVSRTLLKPQKTEDKDFNYTKTVVTGPPPSSDPGIKSLQLLKKIPASSEKRWPAAAVTGANSSVAAPPPPKITNLGNELKPVIVMQRPKSKPVPTVSSSSSEWHPTVTNMNPNGFSHSMPSYGTSVNTQLYDQFHYPHQHTVDNHHFSQQSGISHFNNGGIWNRMGGGVGVMGGGTTTTPTLAAASSLGLFTGSNGSSGPSSPVDWNAGDSVQFDYTNIDWSLDPIPARPAGMWMNLGSAGNGGEFYSAGKAATRPPGLHPEVAVAVGSEAAGGGGGREWSSPFEEKELFSFPRQFVSSPSL
ncbi:hypothetical protein L2E82_45100 [Cichorium intybus]|uniref:Uncharacterized protein n=1 Tax=Cichorium intybus TaxID=13427 RepID=A0ACB8ZSX8_CICIN|nr:hypothetical protein L2E82_45100 [Cichorium intybus]